jgi:hypothetical protein
MLVNRIFFSKITPNLRQKKLLGWDQLFRCGRVAKLRTLTQTHSVLTTASEIVLVGRELALLSHLGSGEPDDCVGGVLLDTTQRPPRLS